MCILCIFGRGEGSWGGKGELWGKEGGHHRSRGGGMGSTSKSFIRNPKLNSKGLDLGTSSPCPSSLSLIPFSQSLPPSLLSVSPSFPSLNPSLIPFSQSLPHSLPSFPSLSSSLSPTHPLPSPSSLSVSHSSISVCYSFLTPIPVFYLLPRLFILALLFVCLPACVPFHLFVCLCAHPPVYLSSHLPFYYSVCLPVYLPPC